MPVFSETEAAAVSRRRFLLAQALPAALATLPLDAFAQPAGLTPLQIVSASGVELGGVYPEHLQGVCTNNRDAIYWSMTTRLVKTDAYGNVVRKAPVAYHHGDICYLDGRIYAAVNLALFNDPQKRSDSWIYVYDGESLAFLSRHKADEIVYGAGGMTFGDGRFIVVGGLPENTGENYVFEYGRDLKFVRRITLQSGQTYKGIQTAAYGADHWWFGCYGQPDLLPVMLKVDQKFEVVGKFAFDCSTGIVPLDRDTFLVARAACGKDGCVARLSAARLDAWIANGLLKPI